MKSFYGNCIVKHLFSALAYLIANGVGLLIAAALLPGFRIDPISFIIVVVLFSVIQAVLGPIIRKIATKKMPQLMGGIALITIFVVLFITDLAMAGLEIGGIANWLAATLLVWVGSLIAAILIPRYVFTQLKENKK